MIDFTDGHRCPSLTGEGCSPARPVLLFLKGRKEYGAQPGCYRAVYLHLDCFWAKKIPLACTPPLQPLTAAAFDCLRLDPAAPSARQAPLMRSCMAPFPGRRSAPKT